MAAKIRNTKGITILPEKEIIYIRLAEILRDKTMDAELIFIKIYGILCLD